MTISTSDNTPRISYTVSQGVTQSSFAVPFEFFADADLNVYLDGTLKTISTHYTISAGGSGSTGTIAFSVTGGTGGSTVIITRGIALDRTTDFPTSGSFAIGTLNNELDRFVAIQADLNDTITRSIRLADDDTAVSMELPDKADRLGKALTFNSSTGAVQVQTYASPTATAGIDGVTAGTVAASKFVQVDANKDIGSFRNLTSSGTITAATFVLGTASLNENDLESIDGITAGTVAASKAAIVDSSKNITGFNNVTLAGELDAATLDISGNANIAGEVQTTKIAFTDGDDAMTITNTGLVEFNTGFNVGSDAAGDILYNNGSKYVRLAKGNDGQALVLTSGLPAWGITAGDIAGVTAGTGLSGGGTSGSVTLNIDTGTTVDKTTSQTLTNKTLTAPAITDPTLTVDNLNSISTIANDDVFLAIDTSGGGLKKVARSVITAGLASSTAISNIVEDTSPELGGNLDVLQRDIVTGTGNRDISLAPHGTGTVVIKGNATGSQNVGAIKLNCHVNTHGQTLKAQPHSATITNTMLLPIGGNSTLVSLISTDTLTNKTLTAPTITDPVITSLLNTSLVVGRDADNQIQFGTDNFITFRVAASPRMSLISTTLSPTGTMDLGSNSAKWQNIFLSGDVEAATLDLSSNADIAGNLTFSGSTAKINLVDNNATALSVKEGSNNYMVFDTANSGGEQITLHKKLDLNGVELILDADADTSIHASTDDQIDIKIAGADDFSFTANTFTAASGSTIAAQALTATTGTFSGILKTDATTDATSTTDGSLQTDGGLSVALDAIIGNDLKLLSDSAVLVFGAGSDATLTHTNDVGLTLNGTNKLMFNDASQFIQGASGTVLDIAAANEIELTSTLIDVVGNLNVSGTVTAPNQPAFCVHATASTNFGPFSSFMINFNQERFDIGSNFASKIFTAPVTGKYQLQYSLHLAQLDTAAAFYQVMLFTSNDNYIQQYEFKDSQDVGAWTVTLSVCADMDANDTANVQIYQYHGGQQTDVSGNSFFSGFLVA